MMKMLEFKMKHKMEQYYQSGKRVYFCANPKDHERFFEHICNLVLSKQICTIYFDPMPDATVNREELFTLLSEMHLFVIPISFEFLTKPSRARDVELAYAMEKHIPVLPLMQDSGIDELFTKVFGNMQYLDEHNRDSTAISFDEKLEKFLNSVLVGDELAEKVRKAFDAYIFLSYRKKDRIYAQQLMRLIHENDFCRDIAIWYDEFLVPGEDFNKAIEAALDHSKLFALAVTPNLINEENYVKNIEFPIARDSEKPMLPAEMVETDRKELAEKFENIGEVTDSRDREALRNALFKKLEGIAKIENDNDPEHNFFIGLAYLKGIDVEVDFERALQLITGAAKAELPEALEKLVDMYRTGTGVEMDYLQAISWQEKLVEVRKKLYEGAQTEENSTALFWVMCHLGEYLKNIAHFEEAMEQFKLLNELAVHLEEKYTSVATKRNVALSYDKLGDIYIVLKEIKSAKKMYIQSFKIRERQRKTFESEKDLSISYKKLGGVYKAEGNLRRSKDMFLAELKILEHLNRANESLDIQRRTAESYINIGNICREEANYEYSISMFLEAFRIVSVLAEREKTYGDQYQLQEICNILFDLYKDEDKLSEFFRIGIEAFGILKANQDNTPKDISLSFNEMKLICRTGTMFANLDKVLTSGVELKIDASCDKRMENFCLILAKTYLKNGEIYRDRKNNESQRMYLQAAELFMSFCLNEESNVKWYIVKCYEELTAIYLENNDYDKAQKAYTYAYQTVRELAEKTKDENAYNHLAMLLFKFANSFGNEKRQLLEACNIWSELFRHNPEHKEYEQFHDITKTILDWND